MGLLSIMNQLLFIRDSLLQGKQVDGFLQYSNGQVLHRTTKSNNVTILAEKLQKNESARYWWQELILIPSVVASLKLIEPAHGGATKFRQ